jgi:hypothetical protein
MNSILFQIRTILALALLAGGCCAPCPCAKGGGGRSTPVGEADRVKATCGTDCECICLEFPGSHAGRRCACGDKH